MLLLIVFSLSEVEKMESKSSEKGERVEWPKDREDGSVAGEGRLRHRPARQVRTGGGDEG